MERQRNGDKRNAEMKRRRDRGGEMVRHRNREMDQHICIEMERWVDKEMQRQSKL